MGTQLRGYPPPVVGLILKKVPVALDSVDFFKNQADYGGAVYGDNASFTVNAGNIDSNAANFDGGGVYTSSSDGTISHAISFTGTNFKGNIAANSGGGIYSYGDNFLPTPATVTLTTCTLAYDSAGQNGGGIYSYAALYKLTDSRLLKNVAVLSGGGGYFTEAPGYYQVRLDFVNSMVDSNVAKNNDGGGVYFYKPDSGSTISGCTFSANVAGRDGAGVWVDNNPANRFHVENSSVFKENRAGQLGGALFFYTSRATFDGTTTWSGNTAIGDGNSQFGHDVFDDDSCTSSSSDVQFNGDTPSQPKGFESQLAC